MALEGIEGPTDYIDSLVRTNPEQADPKSEGDNHIRGVKNTILNTFPNVTGPVSLTAEALNGTYMPGEIRMYGATSIPSGWLVCDGASYLRTTYPDLFAAIGVTWGSADATHFNIPDLRQRVVAGTGDAGILPITNIAEGQGAASHALTADEMPNHAHDYQLAESTGLLDIEGSSSAEHRRLAYSTATTTGTGGGTAHNNVQPTVLVTMMIRAAA